MSEKDVLPQTHQRWADCHILQSRSSLILKNSVQVQPQSEKYFKCKVQVQMKSKKFEKCILFTKKCCTSFALTRYKSVLTLKFWSDLQSGSNPNSAKFAIYRIQSNLSPVQCSFLKHTWSVKRQRHKTPDPFCPKC